MKSLSRLFAIFALLLAGAAAAPKHEKEDTELTKKMDVIKDAFRAIRQQAGDATKNADSLKQVALMKEYAAIAAKMEPFKLTEIPAADRPEMLAGYQAQMKKFQKALDELEGTFKAGHNPAAARLVEDLVAFMKESHKEYKSKSID